MNRWFLQSCTVSYISSFASFSALSFLLTYIIIILSLSTAFVSFVAVIQAKYGSKEYQKNTNKNNHFSYDYWDLSKGTCQIKFDFKGKGMSENTDTQSIHPSPPFYPVGGVPGTWLVNVKINLHFT